MFPILCFLKRKPEKFNKDEVQKVLYAKIDNLMNETNWHYRGFYSNDWIFEIDNEILWGATAKMVRKIFENKSSRDHKIKHKKDTQRKKGRNNLKKERRRD